MVSLKSVGWQSQAEGGADSRQRGPAGRTDAPGNCCGQFPTSSFMAALHSSRIGVQELDLASKY